MLNKPFRSKLEETPDEQKLARDVRSLRAGNVIVDSARQRTVEADDLYERAVERLEMANRRGEVWNPGLDALHQEATRRIAAYVSRGEVAPLGLRQAKLLMDEQMSQLSSWLAEAPAMHDVRSRRDEMRNLLAFRNPLLAGLAASYGRDLTPEHADLILKSWSPSEPHLKNLGFHKNPELTEEVRRHVIEASVQGLYAPRERPENLSRTQQPNLFSRLLGARPGTTERTPAAAVIPTQDESEAFAHHLTGLARYLSPADADLLSRNLRNANAHKSPEGRGVVRETIRVLLAAPSTNAPLLLEMYLEARHKQLDDALVAQILSHPQADRSLWKTAVDAPVSTQTVSQVFALPQAQAAIRILPSPEVRVGICLHGTLNEFVPHFRALVAESPSLAFQVMRKVRGFEKLSLLQPSDVRPLVSSLSLDLVERADLVLLLGQMGMHEVVQEIQNKGMGRTEVPRPKRPGLGL